MQGFLGDTIVMCFVYVKFETSQYQVEFSKTFTTTPFPLLRKEGMKGRYLSLV